MDLGLEGRTAFIAAGSQGLGRAIAERLAKEGVAVAITSRSAENLSAAVAAIKNLGGSAYGVSADLADPSQIDAAIAQAQSELGALDIVLLNTGGPAPSNAVDTPIALWDQQYAELVKPMVRIVERTLPDMRDRKWGRYLYIAAPGILTPFSFTTVSQSMRSAVASYIKTLATAVAADGITANTLIPGVIDTQRVTSLAAKTADLNGITVEQQLERQLSSIPAGRMGTTEEFSAMATFLASPLAGYVTGSIIRIDGGWVSTL